MLLSWYTGSLPRENKKVSKITQIYEIQKGRNRKTTHIYHSIKQRKKEPLQLKDGTFLPLESTLIYINSQWKTQSMKH